MRRIDITCKGCWRILALGISYRTYCETSHRKDGRVVHTQKFYPAHGYEKCPVCGAVHDCGPADFYQDDNGTLISDPESRASPMVSVILYRYRGLVEGPVQVSDFTHDLPETDLLMEQWLE